MTWLVDGESRIHLPGCEETLIPLGMRHERALNGHLIALHTPKRMHVGITLKGSIADGVPLVEVLQKPGRILRLGLQTRLWSAQVQAEGALKYSPQDNSYVIHKGQTTYQPWISAILVDWKLVTDPHSDKVTYTLVWHEA